MWLSSHMLRNCLVGKGTSGAVKAPIASSSAPAPSGMASASAPTSGIGIGRNRLYVLVSR